MGATVESQAQDVSAGTVKKDNKKKKIAEKVGSAKSPTGGAAPRKKPAAKKKVTKNKAAAKKKSATRKKPAPRTGAKLAQKKTSQKKRASKRVARSASLAKPNTIAAATSGSGTADAGHALDDPNSIVWMVEQAEKALIAVKAALAEQASMERAAGKLPGDAESGDTEASPDESVQEAGERKESPVSEATREAIRKAAKSASGKASKKTGKKLVRKPASADSAPLTADLAAGATTQTAQAGPDAPASTISAAGPAAATGTNIVLFRPREELAVTLSPAAETPAPVPGAPVSPEVTTPSDPATEQAVAGGAQTAGQVQPVAVAASSKYRLARVLFAGLVLITGLLTWRYWGTGDEAVTTAQSSAPSQPEAVPQSSAPLQPDAVPQITVSEIQRPATKAATVPPPAAPALSPEVAKTDVVPAPVAATKDESSNPPVAAVQAPSREPAQSPATPATREQPAQSDAAPEPVIRPAVPQQRSRAPRYGYYPPAPRWQQQYYRPAYPRTPAR